MSELTPREKEQARAAAEKQAWLNPRYLCQRTAHLRG